MFMKMWSYLSIQTITDKITKLAYRPNNFDNNTSKIAYIRRTKIFSPRLAVVFA